MMATTERLPEKRRSGEAASDARKPFLDPRNPIFSARSLLSTRFTKDNVRRLHYYRGAFYTWRGGCYQSADDPAVNAAIWKHLDGALRMGPKEMIVPFEPNRARVADVCAALTAEAYLPSHIEAPAWISDGEDRPPASEFLSIKNGLLHLPTEKLWPATPTYFGFNVAGATYDPEAACPRWLEFLAQVWGGDSEAIETLQDVFGYILSGDTSQQKIPLIVGPKRAGKGTIARILTELIGKGNVASPTLNSLESNFGLASLIGKPLAIVGDARISGRANQAVIAERLLGISGEDSQEIDRKYLPAWTGRLPTRFLIMSNELPRLSDASGALASRFIVLVMQNSFLGREDRGLAKRLIAELPGILNWAIEGYHRLSRRGHFLQPDSARDAIEDLEALSSPISAFLKEKCETGPGQSCPTSRLYGAWRDWCAETGRKEPGTEQTFGRDLKAARSWIEVRRPRADGGQVRTYMGIGLRSKW